MALAITRARSQATLAFAGSLVVCSWIGGAVALGVACCTAALAAIAWLAPKGYAPIQRTFDRVTQVVLSGITWLALALVYLGLFTPLRMWRAVTGSDPLKLRRDSTATTYLAAISSTARARFDRQF